MSHNPLLVRRLVLETIDSLASEGRSKQARDEALLQLVQLKQPEQVCHIIVKEMQRSANTNHRLLVMAELLMDIGTLDLLAEPLWQVIQSPEATDTVKDAANLVLRNLGDESDPDAYLEYLDDPEGLIAQETARMLQVATENPAALVDFLDFIVTLPGSEQVRLLDSLQEDYPADQLLTLYVALYWHKPNTDVVAWLKAVLPTIPTPNALNLLDAMLAYSPDEEWRHVLERECQKRRLKQGFDDELTGIPPTHHPLHDSSTPHTCYATLPDGLGNMGLMLTRKMANGDQCLMAVAANDETGLLDAFGFYQLSELDVRQLVDKFHEASLKIEIPPSLAVALMKQAWTRSAESRRAIPYEYTCWSVLLADVAADDLSDHGFLALHAKPEWAPITEQLYLHPDVHTWFLDGDDSPHVALLLRQAAQEVAPLMDATDESVVGASGYDDVRRNLEALADTTLLALFSESFGDSFTERVLAMARLLAYANTPTFAALSATEAQQLLMAKKERRSAKEGAVAPILTPFVRAFGRRCVMEHLLRLSKQHDTLEPFVAWLVCQWEPDVQLAELMTELPPEPPASDDEGA